MTDEDYIKRVYKNFVVGDDGYYIYWPTGNGGAYDANCLRIIADELDRLNEPWDAEIKAYFDILED